jgi:diguanylate cyclase (GGDEF)-like protein
LLVRRDGTETAIEDSASPIFDAAGQAIGAVMVFRDVSETRALALRATHQAQHDFLTELPNRLLLNDRLTQALVLARRHGHYVAVLFVDLDQFKFVNDTFGHLTGDALLQAVAERLVTCVRTSDTVSRLGGDEFLVVLSEVKQVADAASVAQKIIARLATPYEINQRELHVTASVGIAIHPHDGSDAKTLITNADSAMYRAKKAGSNRYHFSDAQGAGS